MTRINTNVSSLVARNTLGRSNAALEQSLTRLSTGLRINTGKDDPAGLIASENLRSDITSIRKAITNSDRANQVIATADSALGQVSSLLNDIRGLVVESANDGALSDDQIAANQLQIDSSLEALNRIAQTTTFQGRKLLDGSLDFITSAGSNFSQLSDLQIDQANLGASGSVNVDVTVTTAATTAQVDIANIPAATAGANASAALTLGNASATQATGTINLQSEAVGTLTLAGETFNLQALDGGNAAGAEGDAVADLAITFGAGAAATSYNASTNTLSVSVTQASATADIGDIIAAINTGTDFDAAIGSATSTTTVATGDDATAVFALTGGNDTINIAADAAGDADGAEGNAVANLNITYGAGSAATSYDASTNTLNVSLTQAAGVATIGNLISAVNAGSDFTLAAGSANTSATLGASDDTSAVFALNGGRDAGAATLNVTADTAGTAANGVTVTLIEDSTLTGANAFSAAVNGSGNIEVRVKGTVTFQDIATSINGLTGYSASLSNTSGDQNYVQSTDTPPSAGTLAGGVASTGGLSQDVVFQLSGTLGSEVFSFGSGTSIADVATAINSQSDATGVEATVNGTTLELTSSEYGSNQSVNIEVIEEGTGGTITAGLAGVTRGNGTDVVASVNGILANGKGNRLSVNTATLDLATSVAAGFTGTSTFDITGGGALFQLGPDVVSNQQARVGIRSVNTGRLGGINGKLYQLGSGGSADLSADTTTAARIVDEAIDQVTSLRGRLGAFQRTTLETNKNALNDTLVNLSDAESTIRDADFAVESASLTRAQILVQSGTTVLQISNQNPQNVLALLR
jgi:flagellin